MPPARVKDVLRASGPRPPVPCHTPRVLSPTPCPVIVPLRLGPDGRDVPALAEFLGTSSFPFHLGRSYTREAAAASSASARWCSADARTYWIEADGVRVGILTLDDLQDPTPMVDLRIADAHRGRGLGVPTLRAATAEAFRLRPDARRLEGQTRDDNLAMRAVFIRAGWVKEAYYREGWEPGHASVAYAILRSDWEAGTTTPVPWEEPAEIQPR